MVNEWEISFGRHVSMKSIHKGLSHTTLVKVNTPHFFFAMDQVVSCQPVVTGAQVSPQSSPCGISDRQSGTETGFFYEYFGFSDLSVIPPTLHIHSFFADPI
jgi:hypothetical protein